MTKPIQLAVLIIALLASGASGAPRIIVTTTKAGDLTILDASKSTGGKLTWRIDGEHEIIFSGTVAVVRFANYTGALVSVSPDGTVAIVLLPVRGEQPPPVDDLTAKVRELAKGLPADQRAKLAKIHRDLAAKAGKEITSSTALFAQRKREWKQMLGLEVDALLPDEWRAFDDAVNDLLDKIDEHIPDGKDGPAADFAEAFRQIAEGLK